MSGDVGDVEGDEPEDRDEGEAGAGAGGRVGACPQGAAIDRQVLGDLDADGLARLKAHVLACEPCRSRLEEATHIETLLVGVFRDVESRLSVPPERVLARLDETRPGRDPSGRLRPAGPPRPRPFLRSRVGQWFLLLNGIAAAFIALAFGTFATLRGASQATLTTRTRVEVRNLAIALESYRERQGTLPPAGSRSLVAALGADFPFASERLADGIYRDPFGGPIAYDGARVYSYGPDGRDDGGAGDDLVCAIQ